MSYWLPRIRGVLNEIALPGEERELDRVCRLQGLLADLLSHRRHDKDQEKHSWLLRGCLKLHSKVLRRTRRGRSCPANWGWATRASASDSPNWPASPRPGTARVRVQKACEMMYQSGKAVPIKQVSEDSGFENEFHFSRRFKQFTGLSPREFRRRQYGRRESRRRRRSGDGKRVKGVAGSIESRAVRPQPYRILPAHFDHFSEPASHPAVTIQTPQRLSPAGERRPLSNLFR